MWKSIRDFLGTNNRILDYVILYISLIASLAIVVQLGSGESIAVPNYLDLIFCLFGILGATLVLRTFTALSKPKQISRFQFWEILFSCYFVLVFIWRYSTFHSYLHNGWIYAGIFVIFLVEISKGSLFFDRFYFNPTLLFVISFLLLISLGTLLLMLPNATTGTLVY